LNEERSAGSLNRALRRFNAVLHSAAGVTMVLLMLWTVADIAGRSLFSRPLPGTVELTELAVVVLVYLGLARAEDENAHISADLLYVRFGERAQQLVRVFAGIVSLGVVSILTWRLFVFAGQMDAGGYSTGVLRIPIYPVAMLGVLGSAAFTLAVLSNLVDSIQTAVRSR
jgi:TRAP-type C4-dicarboxylate transport system permease small subunit